MDTSCGRSENVPKVPLVTEELLIPARRLLWIFLNASEDLTEQKKQEFRERETPSSKGNTITGIDIVLDRAGKGAR